MRTYPDELWSLEDGDELHDDRDEMIEQFLDGLLAREWPRTVCVAKHRRVRPLFDAKWATRCVEAQIEWLDEEFGDPEYAGAPIVNEPTEAAIIAMKAALDIIAAGYTAWTCEPTGETEEVNVAEFVRDRELWPDDNDVLAALSRLEDDGK